MFTPPTLDEEHEFQIAHFKALRPNDDASEGSWNWLWLRTAAAGVTGNHAHIASAKNDLIPDGSEGETLRRWAAIRGVVPKTATPARKAAALRVVGLPTTVVPDGSLLYHLSGLRYRTVGSRIVGPGGYVDCDVVAVDTGSATRLNKGEQLTFTVPVVNLEETAELQRALDEDGDDAEKDGALRLRVLARFSSPPLGGAPHDYEQWALEVTGIAAAFAYPRRRGVGSVHVAALHAGSGTARLLTAPEVADLQAYIDKKRPAAVKEARVLLVVGQVVDVAVTVVPNGDATFEFDWDDSVPPGVASWNAGTRLLTFDLDRPASIQPGDRVIVSNGATGRQRVVESLYSTNGVILEADPLGDVPDAATVLYAGGPLVEPTRAAIQTHFNGLGTANRDAKRYGTWEGNLRPLAVGRVATSVEGVLDATVIAPALTVQASDPAYPDDDEIGLLLAGRILVRKEW